MECMRLYLALLISIVIISTNVTFALQACTNNWAGGACQGNIVYTSATTLNNNVNTSGSLTSPL